MTRNKRKLKCFVSGKPFKPSLTVEVHAEAQPKWSPLKLLALLDHTIQEYKKIKNTPAYFD
jgi:hypothetical protein